MFTKANWKQTSKGGDVSGTNTHNSKNVNTCSMTFSSMSSEVKTFIYRLPLHLFCITSPHCLTFPCMALFFLSSPLLTHLYIPLPLWTITLTWNVVPVFVLVLDWLCVYRSAGRTVDGTSAKLDSVLWPSSHIDHEQCCMGGSTRCTVTCADRKGWQRFSGGGTEVSRNGFIHWTINLSPQWAAFGSIISKWRRRMTRFANLVKFYSGLLRCAGFFRLPQQGFKAIWLGVSFKMCELTQHFLLSQIYKGEWQPWWLGEKWGYPGTLGAHCIYLS